MKRLIRRLTDENGIVTIQQSLMSAGIRVAFIGVAIISVAIITIVLMVYAQMYNVFNEILRTLSNL